MSDGIPGGGGVRDRIVAWRNRLLASPRFRRWSMRFPPTRPIARRRARALFDLCAGFVYSQVLLACVRLELFEKLSGRPRSAGELATELELPEASVRRLLIAATSLQLVQPTRDERFTLGVLGAALVGDPGIAAMIEHHPRLYADLLDPVALLRDGGASGELSRYWAYAGASDPARLSDAEVAAYSALMAKSQSLIADQVLDAHPMDGHRELLDVGGGEGAFLIAAARRSPSLRLALFDLPSVADRARARLEAAGLAERATVHGGDFLRDALPTGADLVSLVRIVHDHDDASALRLLRAVRAAIADEGTLLLAEPMAGTAGAEPMADAYFGFYLLAMGSGRARHPDELRSMLRQAGFDRIRLVATDLPLQTRLIVARPAPG